MPAFLNVFCQGQTHYLSKKVENLFYNIHIEPHSDYKNKIVICIFNPYNYLKIIIYIWKQNDYILKKRKIKSKILFPQNATYHLRSQTHLQRYFASIYRWWHYKWAVGDSLTENKIKSLIVGNAVRIGTYNCYIIIEGLHKLKRTKRIKKAPKQSKYAKSEDN